MQEPMLPSPEASRPPIAPEEQSSAILEVAPVSPETSPNTRPEQPRETAPVAAPAQPTAQSTPPPPVQMGQPTTQDPMATVSPQIADDVDVIEKEWVDKAKKIVSATKDNPYEQEKEVSKLQADYLSKRYNKQIKLTE